VHAEGRGRGWESSAGGGAFLIPISCSPPTLRTPAEDHHNPPLPALGHKSRRGVGRSWGPGHSRTSPGGPPPHPLAAGHGTVAVRRRPLGPGVGVHQPRARRDGPGEYVTRCICAEWSQCFRFAFLRTHTRTLFWEFLIQPYVRHKNLERELSAIFLFAMTQREKKHDIGHCSTSFPPLLLSEKVHSKPK